MTPCTLNHGQDLRWQHWSRSSRWKMKTKHHDSWPPDSELWSSDFWTSSRRFCLLFLIIKVLPNMALFFLNSGKEELLKWRIFEIFSQFYFIRLYTISLQISFNIWFVICAKPFSARLTHLWITVTNYYHSLRLNFIKLHCSSNWGEIEVKEVMKEVEL